MRFALSVVGLLALSVNMLATPITFATFAQTEANLASPNNPFGLKYNSATRTLTTYDAQNYAATGGANGHPAHVSDNMIDGNFTFVPSGINGLLPVALQNVPLAATLSVSKTITGNNSATCTTSSCEQPLNDLENNTTTFFRITLTQNIAAAMGFTNLLTIRFTGDLSGRRGGNTAGIAGDTGVGDTVIFSSDFLNFSNATQESLNLALNSIRPSFQRIGAGTGASNLQTFVSGNVVGNFASDPRASVNQNFVPEPTSFILIGSAMVGLGLLRRSRRS